MASDDPHEDTLQHHSAWRFRMAERLGSHLEPQRFGVKALYVIGSVKHGTAGPASDIDLLVLVDGTQQQRDELMLWLEGWSLCLDEVNLLRTGYCTGGLLDVHVVTAQDIARRTSYAIKIGSTSDPARPIPLKV
jgi:pyruvate,water dikinase